MAKKRFGIDFKGFTEIAADLDRLQGDLKKTTEKALDFIPDMVNPDLHSTMSKHKRTGKTEESITNERVTWEGTRASIPVGFDISHGGLPSIFLMYGTPRHAPANQYGPASGTNRGMQQDKKLYNAIFGNSTNKKIAEKQQEIFEKEIKKVMK